MDRRTPPPISWADLAGRRVGVWGLGREGAANLRRLDVLGVDPVLVDDRPPADRPDVLPTDGPGLDALLGCDVVIKTPGISRYRPEVEALWAADVPVLGGLGLWLAGMPLDRVVCVTGSKGKSTTTSVLGHLLAGLGRRVVVGGNIGRPPWDPAEDTDDEPDLWVVETSSFQATDLPVSPAVVAVTSLSPDHLNWHRDDVATYYADKLSVCRQPGAEVTVANGLDSTVRANRSLLGPRVEWVVPARDEAAPEWVTRLGLLGWHNRVNAEIARACVAALGVPADDAALVAAAEGMAPLESRMQVVGTVDGATVVDDSLSTNVLSAIAAVDAFDGPVALLAGGYDRGIDYAPLARALAAREAPTLLVAMPTNGPRIVAAVEAAGQGGLEVCPVADLEEGVARAHAWLAGREGTVLLSPAAASFDRFADYRARGAAFAAAMHTLRP